jgi:hypothetical protein
LKTYFDGSVGEDERGDTWITLAGIAATDSVWADLETRWEKMLCSRYPVAPYVHMIELLGHEDPFEEAAGWTLEKKHDLVQDALILLSHINKAEFRMVWSSINESERIRLEGEGVNIVEDPYVRCAADCVFFSGGKYLLNVPEEQREPLYVFYDRGEKFLGRFKNNWLSHRTRPGRPKDPQNWFDLLSDVQDVDLPYHAGLQMADMIAWANSRALSESNRTFSWLKEWLLKVVPSTGMEYDGALLRRPRDYSEVWDRNFSPS